MWWGAGIFLVAVEQILIQVNVFLRQDSMGNDGSKDELFDRELNPEGKSKSYDILIDPLRITPQSLSSGPPDQSTWMFLYSLIQEWSGRVFWYAAWRHYASGLFEELTAGQHSSLVIDIWGGGEFKSAATTCGLPDPKHQRTKISSMQSSCQCWSGFKVLGKER